jgi:acyl-CoA reductase-like NAD-dependent aldehyde dehydrogenase
MAVAEQQVGTTQQQYIDGKWVDGSAGGSFEDYSPFTGEVFSRVASGTKEDAVRAIEAATAAFPMWAATAPKQKQKILLKAADIVDQRADDIGRVLAEETGGVPAFVNFQLTWITGLLRQAAGWVYLPTGEVIPSDYPGALHMAIRRPLGVIAGFSPWNGASLLAWRTVVSPIAFGNTMVLKPSEFAPVSAGTLVAEILEEAGLPAGVLNVVTHGPGEAEPIADEFFENPAVRLINFTGSSAIGRLLAERAGRALKPIVLELGGYNPLIVLDDADMEYAVNASAFGAFMHQGQVCMATRKVIIDEGMKSTFLDNLAEKVESYKIGDPSESDTIIGPLIHNKALGLVKRDVEDAVAKGARVVTGGQAEGSCWQPTVLTDVPKGTHLYNEETFGPVLVVQSVSSVEEAIEVANDHKYGLSAGVITGDPDRGLAMAPLIETGIFHINDQTVADEPQMPLGGVRNSGWGRSGPHSVEDFTHVQWVSVQNGAHPFPI